KERGGEKRCVDRKRGGEGEREKGEEGSGVRKERERREGKKRKIGGRVRWVEETGEGRQLFPRAS
ncbi:hypothetical protein, partial [Escherichia coli]|uniref:hypothetical protein n=1 Tax=Escherichia coli TaxID=562 RepID=UPI00159106BD